MDSKKIVALAKKVGLSRPHMYRVTSGESTVSRRSAEDCETIMGIAREAWMFPERWRNPYIDTSSPDLPAAEDYAGKKRQDWPRAPWSEPLSQVTIATRARRSPVALNYIIKGARPAGKKMAESLEETTGVAREAWIWPDRWFNKYIEGSSPHLPQAEVYTRSNE